jgi:hypothetical protein
LQPLQANQREKEHHGFRISNGADTFNRQRENAWNTSSVTPFLLTPPRLPSQGGGVNTACPSLVCPEVMNLSAPLLSGSRR